MNIFKAQYILNPVAKKQTFCWSFQPELQLQMIPKRLDRYDQHIINIAGKNGHYGEIIYTKLWSQKKGYFGEILSHNYSCKKFPRDLNNMITFKAQHIGNSAAKKRIFWRNFKPQLQLEIIPKRPDQYDQFQSSTYTKTRDLTNMITSKAQHILNPAAIKRIFWRNFKPQLQPKIIPKRPD